MVTTPQEQRVRTFSKGTAKIICEKHTKHRGFCSFSKLDEKDSSKVESR